MLTLFLPTVSTVAKTATPTAPVVKTVEAVGVPFEAITMHDRLVGRVERAKKELSEAQKRAIKAAQSSSSPLTEKRMSVKITEEDTGVNWYEVLEIAEDASSEEIEVAYKKRILETHPDKQPDHSDKLFKQVQRGYALLFDADSRRALDSARPFDDSVPKDIEYDEATFYKTFAPVFHRNAKFSVNPNVPELGDEKTPLKDAKKFYDFWMAFRSWRDFAHVCDLHAIEEGMGRDEKRYYQRENQRAVQSHKADEGKRVRGLVDLALKNDPRIAREREAEEQARNAAREAREAEKRKTTEEARRKKDEAAAAEKAAKEAAEQAIEDAKNAHKTAVKTVGDFLRDHQLVENIQTNGLFTGAVRRPNISYITQNANAEEAVKISDEVCKASPLQNDDGSVDAVLAFNANIAEIELRVGRNRFGEAVKKETAQPNAVTDSEKFPEATEGAKWTKDDEAVLEKVVARYPEGADKRFVLIGAALQYKFVEKDIVAKIEQLTPVWKAIAAGEPIPASAQNTGGDWTPAQLEQLKKALRTFKDSNPKGKFAKIAEHVEGKSAQDCAAQAKIIAPAAPKPADAGKNDKKKKRK